MPTEAGMNIFNVISVLVQTFTLGTLVVFTFKCGQFVSETRIGIKDAKDVAKLAHKRIDKIEQT